MDQGNYFQFPLCVLSMEAEPHAIASRISAYGVTEAGRCIQARLTAEQRREKCGAFGIRAGGADELELAARLGAEVLNLTLGNDWKERHRIVWTFAADFEKRYGQSPLVRIDKETLWEVRDGGRTTWREFRVLCAIFSSIGSKTFPVVIPSSMINARSCGFASQSTFAAGVAAGQCGASQPLTPKQLRLTIEKLWMLRRFGRVTPDPHGRVTYYSHRLSEEQMIEKIFGMRTYKAEFRAKAREKSEALSDRLKAAKGTFNSPAEKGTFNRDQGTDGEKGTFNRVVPDGSQQKDSGQKGGAPSGHREGTAKGTVRAPIIETLSIETRVLETPSMNSLPRASARGVSDADERPDNAQQWGTFLKQEQPEVFRLYGVLDYDVCSSLHRRFTDWKRQRREQASDSLAGTRLASTAEPDGRRVALPSTFERETFLEANGLSGRISPRAMTDVMLTRCVQWVESQHCPKSAAPAPAETAAAPTKPEARKLSPEPALAAWHEFLREKHPGLMKAGDKRRPVKYADCPELHPECDLWRAAQRENYRQLRPKRGPSSVPSSSANGG